MAKWGEGDPRWIVEERPDATNVNNWHWTEKNASEWSRNKFKELLIGLSIDLNNDSMIGTCTTTEIVRADGDASANNRKAKLIFFFEWNLEIKFEADLETSDEKITGSLEIPNLSDENTAEEVDVNVKVDSTTEEAYKVKEVVRKKMAGKIKEALSMYIKQLKDEYGKNLILPTKDKASVKPTSKGSEKNGHLYMKPDDRVIIDTQHDKSKGRSQVGTRTLEITETFYCSPSDLYQVFVTPGMVQAFTRNPCEVDAKIGGHFRLFNGHVDGKFEALEPGARLVFTWRTKNWPNGHYSTAILNFKGQDCSTSLHVEQHEVPEDHYETTEDGWRRHYIEAIKQTFGFGTKLF